MKTNEKEDSESTLIKLNASDSLPNMIEATTPKIEKISLEYKTDHLLGYDELTTATALFGDEYKLIFKTLWYILLSYQIRTSKLSVGRIKPDGRISGLFIINSGRGKGELKRVQKEYVKYFNGNYREPTSLHAEQLVGKSVYDKKNKEYEERKGYLRADFLIIDEAFNLLSSKELHYAEARKYIRTALDPYPHNEVCKQSVELGEGHELKYTPECPIILFVQPLRFGNDTLILEGDIRRFIPVYVPMGDSNKIDALKRRVFDSYNDEDSILEFCKKISNLEVFESFTMDIDAKVRFFELSSCLVERGQSYSNKIANFMEMITFTIQNNLMNFAAVQAFQHFRNIINVEDVEIAYMDLFEIMEHTYQFVELKIPGLLDYGDGWQGARLKDQEILKWLYEQGATTEESSNVSIQKYEDQLMDLYNISDRQSRTYKSKHESNGWIKSKNAPGISKIWLTFNPHLTESTGATLATPAPYHNYQKLVEKLKPYTTIKRGAPVSPVAGDNDQEEISSIIVQNLPFKPSEVIKRIEGTEIDYRNLTIIEKNIFGLLAELQKHTFESIIDDLKENHPEEEIKDTLKDIRAQGLI